MKQKRVISCLLTAVMLFSTFAAMPQTVLAGTETVSQTVFELDIDALKAGTVPAGVTLNTEILDEEASSSSTGLISDAMDSQTAFLTLDLEALSGSFDGVGTGLYTIEVVVNQNDSDSTTLNGMLMSMTGTAKKDVWRVRESADVAVFNSWTSANSLFSSGNKSAATASYVFTNLDVNTGAIASHAAKYGTSPAYNGYANGQSVAAGNASIETPINTIEFRTAKTSQGGAMRVNIQSLTITRQAEVNVELEQFSFTAASEDNEKGTVTVSGLDNEGKANEGSEVTFIAVPEESYVFSGWYKDGANDAIEGADATYTITASAETEGSYVAKFQRVAKVDQTVFELDIEALMNGTIPTGVTFNDEILDRTNSSAENGLISTVVSGDTEFLKIDFSEATAGLAGVDTGLYTIELVTNVNDSDDTTNNGTLMYLKGTSDMMVFRARENSDICAMPNTWTGLHWKTNTGETASYGIENLNVKDGSADAHYAMRDESPQYDAYANGHALAAGNATAEDPIDVLTIKAGNTRRANIKSLRIVRAALIPPVTYVIGAESYDEEMGSVTISATSVESGESVTLIATPEAGCVFEGWYDRDTDARIQGAEAEWTFSPSESKNYVAKFSYLETYEIVVRSEDEERGTVTVSLDAPYYENDEILISAASEDGYIFDGWYKDGSEEKLSSDATYTIIVSEATEGEYVAKFRRVVKMNQTVFELDIEALMNGDVPDGVTLNEAILDSTNTSDANGLISDVVSGDTEFLKINFAEAAAELEGVATGVYTIEIVTNVNDSDGETDNGTLMNLKGTSDVLVFRARENSDICALKNSGWADGLYWRTETAGTATYRMENLNINTGAAEAHWLMRGSVVQHTANANGQALGAGNASEENPINILTVKAANGRRANIKSIKIVREVLIPSVTYEIGAESQDETRGSVEISATRVESGDSVTLRAIPEENYMFTGWYDKDTDTKIQDAGAEWTFYPTESKNYVAKFIYSETYEITVRSADEEKGSVTVSKNAPYYENDEIILSARAKTGYVFDGWYKTGSAEKLSSDATYAILASTATEGEYIAKFIRAAFQEQAMYEFDLEGILNGTISLPDGITLNESVLDENNSSEDNGLMSDVSASAQTLITVDFDELIATLGLEGLGSGVYKVELAVNVKDDAEEVNGTNLYAVTEGGLKQLLEASESAGVRATNGAGMNGGGDSYNRTYVTYSFEINVQDGTVTSMLTDQTGSNIFSSVANGQTVTLPAVSENNPITKLEIKNIANQRANVKSLNISRNIAIVDYGNDTPVFNETSVTFVDGNGETLRDTRVTAAVKSIVIDFKSVLDETTVNNTTVYVEKDGVKLDVEPVHCDGVVTFDVNGLVPNATYKVCVGEDIKNVSGVTVRSAGEYSFTTKSAEFYAHIKDIKADGTLIGAIADLSEGDRLEAEVSFVNTSQTARDLYVVYAAYKNNALADIKIAEYNDNGYNISGKLTPGFTVGDLSGVSAIHIFVLDEWNATNILDSKTVGTVFTCTSGTENSVKADSSLNKITISAVADAADKIWVEVVKGDKAHADVFVGLSKTDDVYTENLPIRFFGTFSGSFSVELPLTEADDYTVYVKNITDGEMLLDGAVVTFTDATTYESLISGLDTSSREAFIASLTDDVAKKLGFDIPLNEHLSGIELRSVKEKLFAEGLSATDDEANKKMYCEYAVMEFVNNNTTVSAAVAADVVDGLLETISADETLKEWFNKYIVDADDETQFVNKLLASEPVSTREVLSDAVKVALVLEIAKDPNGYTNIKSAFDAFKSAFGRDEVSSSNAVYAEMIGTYADKDAFLSKYDDVVEELFGGNGGGSSGSSGGSGGGSGSPNGPSGNVSVDAGSANVPSAPMNNQIFTDIDSVPWAQEAIIALKVKNVIAGKTETEFYPNDKITREEFTKLIAAAFAKDAEKAELSFVDADPNAWYYPYVQQAKAAGLVNGMSDSFFGIGQNITRQDMAVMIYNAAKYKNVIGSTQPEEFPFADDQKIADYAKEAVYTLKAMGIINGVDEDTFAPLATATRAEAAVMIYRLLLK